MPRNGIGSLREEEQGAGGAGSRRSRREEEQGAGGAGERRSREQEERVGRFM